MAGGAPRARIEGWVWGLGFNLVSAAVLLAVAWGTFTASTPASIETLKSTVDVKMLALEQRLGSLREEMQGIERRANDRADRIETRLSGLEDRERRGR